MLAPALTPLVSKYLGWPWAVALGGMVCLVGAAFWLWIDPRPRGQDAAESSPSKQQRLLE
jgi:hypothetical protein